MKYETVSSIRLHKIISQIRFFLGDEDREIVEKHVEKELYQLIHDYQNNMRYLQKANDYLLREIRKCCSDY